MMNSNRNILIQKCDVIIPIYNSYECVVECIEFVIKNTDLKENNLILINDKSTDSRIKDLLEKYHKKYPKFLVLENKENLGFVKTVNKGMKLSKNDVLLLNSDTIVTPNWLEKIKECAYSGEMIATVTPLSNNATLASVPNIFERNELPADVTLEQMAKIVEECSYKDYPELPTGHGFCLYIKRSVLDEVGYFDEDAFGKGYGEENDFCFRCFEYGYRHLLCDDTYIYHKESQSFSDTKLELMKNGEKVLEERYPQYEARLRDWNFKRPIKYIGQNIAFEIGKLDKKQNILILIHDWKKVQENLGGTTLHVNDLIQNLRKKYNFHVLAPEDNFYKLHSYWTETESQIVFPKPVNFKDFGYYNKDYSEILDRIISDFDIKILHIHHMIGHYFDIKNLIQKYKLFSIISLHDLYSTTPRVNEVQENTLTNSSVGAGINKLENWNKVWKNLFDVANFIITPTQSAKKEIKKVYEDARISIIEHGVNLKKEKSDLSIEGEDSFDIAFLGVMVKHKGGEIFEYLIKEAKLKNIRIHLFGASVKELPKDSKYFINHGAYQRQNLSKLLKENDIKLVCLFSMVPETYSYTLTESIASGIPVLGIDYGAIGERIKRDNLGWLIDIDSEYSEYISKINEILHNPEEYKKIIHNINNYSIRSTDDMVKDYENLYRKVSVQNSSYEDKDIKHLIKISGIYLYNTIKVEYPDYSWVFNTLKWRIISKLKIPQSIKEMYKKVRNKKI